MNTFEVSLLVAGGLVKYIVNAQDEDDAQYDAAALASQDYPRATVQVTDVLYMGSALFQAPLLGVDDATA